MPFVKRTVEPVHLSDKPVPKCCRNELEAVSNFTLCGLIRQLACLADQANSIFDEIGIETKLVFDRTNTLIFRVEKLKANVHNLDARAVKVPESNLDDYSGFRGHYHAPPAISKDLFTEATRPRCVKDLRSAASTNFTDILRKCKEYQNDTLLVKSVMETRWMSAQDHLDSQYELDVCKRRKQTIFVNSPKGARPLSEGDAHEDYFARSNAPLPTPEEVARQNILPSSVISIDVTGCSFQRMSSLRRSNGSKNKRSSLRRRTICGAPTDVRVAPSSNEDYQSLPIVGLELDQDSLSRTQSLDRNLILRRQSLNEGQYAVVQPIGTRRRPFSLRLQKRPKSLGKYETLPEGKHVDLHGNGTSTLIVRRSNKKEDGGRKGIRVTMPDHPSIPTSCQSCETLPPYTSADSLESSVGQERAESSSPLRPKSMELDRKHLHLGQIPKSASAEHIKRSTYIHNNIPKTNSSTMTEMMPDVVSLRKTEAENLSTTTHSPAVKSDVRLRSSKRHDERQSSSGNWSESDSNRNSLQSDTSQSWISDASSSLVSTCDSAVSMNCPEKIRSPKHGRSSSDVSQTSDSTLTNAGSEEALMEISKKNNDCSQTAVDFSITHMDTESWLQSVGAMQPVVEKAFGNQAPMQKHDYDPAMLSDTCSSSLTSIDNFENSSELSDDLEMYLGQSGSEVFDSSNSLCSIDTDGYWTSMHSDCGLPSMSRRQTKYMPPSAIPIGYTSEESESGSRHSTRILPRRMSPKMRLRKKKSGSPASDRPPHSSKENSANGSSKDTDKGTKTRPTSLKLPNSGALSPNSRSSSPGFSDTTSETSSYDLPEPMRTPSNGGLYTICFTGSMQLDDMIKCTSERNHNHQRSNSISSLSSAGYDDSPNNTLTKGSSTSNQTSMTSNDHPSHNDLWKKFGNQCEGETQKPEPETQGNESSIQEVKEDGVVSDESSTNSKQTVHTNEADQSNNGRKSYYDHRYGIFVLDTLDGSECNDHLPSPPGEELSKTHTGEMHDNYNLASTNGNNSMKSSKPSKSIPEPMKSSVKNDGRLSPPKFVTPSPRLPRKTVMTTDLDRVLQWNETSFGQPAKMVSSKINTPKTKESSKPMNNHGATSQGENSASSTISALEDVERQEPIWQRQQTDGSITETDIVWEKQSPLQMRSNKVVDKEKVDLPSPDGFGSEGYNTIKRSPRQKMFSSTTSQSMKSPKDLSEHIHVSIPTTDESKYQNHLQPASDTEHRFSSLQSSDQHVQRHTSLANNNESQSNNNISTLNVHTTHQSSNVHKKNTGNEDAYQSPIASSGTDDYTLLDSPDSQTSQQLQSSLQNAMPAVKTITHGCDQHHTSPLGSPVKDKNSLMTICHLDTKQEQPDVLKDVPIKQKDTSEPSVVHNQNPPGNNQISNENSMKSQNDSYIEFETSFGACKSEKMSVNTSSSPQQARRQDIFVQAEPSLQLISPVEKRSKNDSRNSFRNSYREELQNSNNDPDLAIIRAAGKIENGRHSSQPVGVITPKFRTDSSNYKTSFDPILINGFDASGYHSPSRGSESDSSSPRPNRHNSNHIEEGTDSCPTQYVFDPNRKPTFSILKKRIGESDKSLKNSKERLSFLQANRRKSNLKNDDLYRKAVMASLSNANGPFGSDSSIASVMSPRSITFSDTVIVDHTPVKVCQASGKPQTSLEDFRYLLQQQSPSSRTESAASALNVRGKNNRHNATELLVKTASTDRNQLNGFAEPVAAVKMVTMNEIRNVMEGSVNSKLQLLPNPPLLDSPTEVPEVLGYVSRQSIPIPPPDATFNWLKGNNISTPPSDKPSPGPSRSLLMEEIRRQPGSVSRLVAINQIDQQLDKKLQTLPGDERDSGQPEFHGLFNSISTKVKKLPLAENVAESEHEYPTDAWD
ncbi:Nance-Horan syndrome protein-like isoform X2 [Anneissia japonica]|uniref:Nance-Horan syndrome protein-like isoform X2 n=1 Tax=Anneissia japonica TaxID=1529436 RepID=UPI001425AA09|nr:Nance-Horan syndrome protein-like isoform X2 [Anneissia japonica]